MTHGVTDTSRTTRAGEDGTDSQVATQDLIPNAANATQAAEAPGAGRGAAASPLEHQTEGSPISPGGVGS
jgi:hypothetical protein